MRKILTTLALALVVYAGFAQETGKGLGFSAGFGLGTEVIADAGGTSSSWTKLSFQPDLAFGKIGIGLDLPVHFQLYKTAEQAITFYGGDWIPNYQGNKKNFFDVYLPKFQYIRYGLKGEDPVFAKYGSFDDMSLGHGFIMSEYSNQCFEPTLKIRGLDLGVDGRAFNFPYVGIELVTGNLARFDVSGGRLYGRPLLWLSAPIVKDLEIGATLVGDSNAYLYKDSSQTGKSVSVFGLDATLPIIQGKLFPLAVYTDLAFEKNSSMGAMLGAGGKLLGFLNYGAQIRILQDGFIPSYFDSGYDLYRGAKYDLMETKAGQGFTPAWLASLGFSLLDNKLGLSARLDGPFKAIPAADTGDPTDYPHLKGVVYLGEGLLAGLYFTGTYEKYYLGRASTFWKDLADPTNAIAGLAINYKTGAAVITLKYNGVYIPTTDRWQVTSSLTASVRF